MLGKEALVSQALLEEGEKLPSSYAGKKHSWGISGL